MGPGEWLCAWGLMASLLLFPGCWGPGNKPHKVVKEFLLAVNQDSKRGIDSLVAWDKVLINDYFVTRDYFKAATPEKKREIIQDYKNKFYQDYLPLIRQGSYEVKTVFVSRGDSDALIQLTFPRRLSKKGNKEIKFDFRLRMQLIPERKRWLITDFGDLLRLHFLQGDFNPDSFYLSKPIHP